MMKRMVFVGDSLARLRQFPEEARRQAGHDLRDVQKGKVPSNWKPMPTIGTGVCELRIRDVSGAFRVIYLATLPQAVYVLHAFQKKTQKTAQRDLNLAAVRLQELIRR